MTRLDHQIRRAQRLLWANRWLHDASRSVAVAGVAYACVVLVQRLYALAIPLLWIGLGLGATALIVAGISTFVRREGAAYAAAVLDAAAGLRERISSGRYCATASDPFAQAVVADAEQVCASLTVRRHVRIATPRHLGWTGGAVALAALMFLITPGVLKRTDATPIGIDDNAIRQTHVAVKRTLDSVQRLVATTPALQDLNDELSGMDKRPTRGPERPASIRHEALKKIDKLSDAVKKKRRDPKYGAASDMRKMLRGLKVPKESDAPTRKLARSLARGDFKTAREELKALKEQLATLKLDTDKELVNKLSKQLNDLAKQLDELAWDNELMKKLQQAGIKKEDLERMLANLKKKDLDQIKKQLADKGFSQKDIAKLAKQLQRKQKAGSQAKQLAQAMKNAGQCNNPGQMGEAIEGLSAAAQQLSDIEALEQEMGQLDSALADLQGAKNDLDSRCSQCQGTGRRGGKPCGKCSGSGRGMGRNPKSGRGGLAAEAPTDVAFKVKRQKVHTGKGAIIGQFLVDGEQVKGDVAAKLIDVVSATERDASELINRDRIPRQYQKAVKDYFSNIRRAARAPHDEPDASARAPDTATSDTDAPEDAAAKDADHDTTKDNP